MNTPPTLISPARAVDMKAGAARETDAAETPFNKVLSDEMASQRNAQAGRQSTSSDKPAAAEAAPRTEPTSEATAAGTAETATPAEPATADALDPALQALVPDPAALLGLAAMPVAAPVAVSVAAAPPGTEGAELTLDAALTAEGAGERALPLDIASRRGRTLQQPAGAQADMRAAAMQAEDAPLGNAASRPAASAAAAAPAIQLAAARQPDTANTVNAATESSFEQLLQPALRAAEPLPQAAARLNAELAQPRLAPSVGSQAWGQALGDRIVWMANAAQQTATLTLNPPNLGPLQVVLNVSNDQAVANFYAAQPEVRQALESAFPRLKEMLNEAGIQLEQATVSADTSPQQQDTAAGRSSGHAAGMRSEAATLAAELPAALPPQRTGRGLIDTFA